MIILGLVIMLICWAISYVFPLAEPPVPALLHVGWVVGVIVLIVGIILLILSFVRPEGTIAGRRRWY